MKRKRAQLASEPSQTHADAVTEGNQQPDLDELSRGLPSGWQVTLQTQYFISGIGWEFRHISFNVGQRPLLLNFPCKLC